MSRQNRTAFSLLEVLFAMSILLGSIAVLGELSRIGTRNARMARDLTMAELLCESKINEIAAGNELPETAEGVPLDDNPSWLYSVSVEEVPVDQPGLMSVRVRVSQDLPEEKRPAAFTLVRWMRQRSIQSADTDATDRAESFAFPSKVSPRGP